MNKDHSRHITSSRRTFLQGGALLAVPVAASASAMALAGGRHGLNGDNSDALARLARLEDEAAIRQLHSAWLQRVNAGEQAPLREGSVRRITADPAGAADRIEIAADGRSASGHFDHTVELESALAADCALAGTLVQMAHIQGHGGARRVERRSLTVEYRKDRGSWRIERATLRPLDPGTVTAPV